MAALHEWQGIGTTVNDGYEWFYFDAENPAGEAVFISIMGPNPFDFSPFGTRADGRPGAPCPHCPYAPLPQNHYGVAVGGLAQGMPFEAEGYVHLSDPARDVTFTSSPWKLTFPGATVERSTARSGLPTYLVTLDVTDPARACRVQGCLEFVATHPEWTVPGALLVEDVDDRRHRHSWAVHAPQAHVSGRLVVTLQGAEHVVSVDRWIGYHDHNWGTRRISVGFARWTWGRALLPDGRTVIDAAIIPNLQHGELSLRVPQVSVVLSPRGVESQILTLIEPPGPGSPIPNRAVQNGIETPAAQSFGVAAGTGHHVRFDTLQVIPGEFPGRYQRRIAAVTLIATNGAATRGAGVTETLVAANFP